MSKLRVEVTGVNTLLMHAPTGANPLDPRTKAYKAISGKRNKTDEDQELISKLEFEMNVYFDKNIGYYLPANVFEQSIKNGAKKNKKGKTCNIGMRILEERVPLKVDAPKDIEKTFTMTEFVDCRLVVVNGKSRVIRTRPRFDRWSATFTVEIDESIWDNGDFILALNNAGALVGVGDLRPDKGGRYGTFECKIVEI